MSTALSAQETVFSRPREQRLSYQNALISSHLIYLGFFFVALYWSGILRCIQDTLRRLRVLIAHARKYGDITDKAQFGSRPANDR